MEAVIARERISANELQRRKKRGQRIKDKREAAELTQEQLAKKLDFSPGHIWRIENGVRGIDEIKLMALAGIFGCDVKELDPDVLTAGENELIRVWSDLDADNRNLLLYLAHEVLRAQLGKPVTPEVQQRRDMIDQSSSLPLRLPRRH